MEWRPPVETDNASMRSSPLMNRPFASFAAAFSIAFISLLAIELRLAWVGDDSYITLRCVENVAAGHGPVWNVAERVQVFTHPLWLWLLVLARAFTSEMYLVLMALSVGLTTITALVLAAAAGLRAGILVLLLLAMSRSFTVYAVSGLECPLAFLLLALIVRAARSPQPSPLKLACIAGLGMMHLIP